MSGAGLPDRIGRYRIRSAIGAGGFATVVLAHDDELSSMVAVKVLSERWADDDVARDRFLAEARHLRRVRSPAVVAVHDIGGLDDGRPYFVMELADRGSLAERLESRPRGLAPDPPGLRRLVVALAEGLAALHGAGLVHRDLNPRNLLLRSARGASDDVTFDRGQVTAMGTSLVRDDERVLIGDLGLAKDLVESSGVSIVGGSPHYQAPEQLDPDGEISESTDVFAASALLWEVLTGTPPPSGDRLAERLGDLESRWRPAISHGMSVAARERPSTMSEWADEVLAVLGEPASTGSSAGSTPRAAVTECPYRGLAAYQAEHAAWFFGREMLIGEALERLRHDRTLVIAGPSGSGKSSLLRAGVLPALAAGEVTGSERWPSILMTPGAEPVKELAYQLERVAASHAGGVASVDSSEHSLRLAADTVCDATGGLVLAVDQFEEVFTHPTVDVRDAFLDQLAMLADPVASRVRVVLAMRADFYARAAGHPWLARRINENQMLVGPMERTELRRAIAGPAARAGLEFEEGLVDVILDEAGSDAGSLPLLGHALAETWRRRDGRRLTLAGFRDAGGVAGSIAQTAESVYESALTGDERDEARRLLLRLVNVGDGVPHTRRRVPLDDLRDDSGAPSGVIEQLVDARLLTVDGDAVEITHEALATEWPRLRSWIDGSVDDLRLRGQITRAAADWSASDHDPDLLYRGTPLAVARDRVARTTGLLGPREVEFLDASTAAEAELHAAEARESRRQRVVRAFALAGALGIVVVSVVAWALIQRTRSDERSTAAEERVLENLGLVARLTAPNDPLTGLALGVEARARTEGANRDAWLAVVGSRQSMAETPIVEVGSATVGDVLSVALAPDGPIALAGRRDGSLAIVDTETLAVVGEGMAHDAAIEEIAFAPTGDLVATAGLDEKIVIWSIVDPASPAVEREVETGSLVWSVDWSPDGTTLATATEDGEVRLWDAATGDQIGDPLTESLDMLTVAFNGDGSALAAGNGQGLVWVWSLPERTTVIEALPAHASDVWEIVFSPDGAQVATASSDGTVGLFDAASGGTVEAPFVGISGTATSASTAAVAADLRGVQFDEDGDALLAGTETGEVVLWDLDTGSEAGRRGPAVGSQVLDSALVGNRLVTIGADQMLREWLAGEPVPLDVPLGTDGEGSFSVAIDPDERYVVTGDGAGEVRFHDRAGAETDSVLVGDGPVREIAVSVDGGLVAAATDEGRIVLLDASGVPAGDAGEVVAIDGHDGLVRSLAFDPTGAVLASGGVDGITRLWRLDDASLVAELGDHPGGVGDLAWTADGERLVVVGWDGRAEVWTRDGEATGVSQRLDDNALLSVAVSPDGRTIAVGSDDEVVTLWPTDFAAPIGSPFTALPGGATGVAFVDEGRLLVASAGDGTIRLWDVDSGLPIGAPLVGEAAPVNRLATTDAGPLVASATEGGDATLWTVLDFDTACRITDGVVDPEQPGVLDTRLTACEQIR